MLRRKQSTAAAGQNKLSDTFNQHYDDSSDEEDVTESISHYSITESWQQKEALQEKKLSGKNLLNDNLLSFVAHAAGIKFLYSPEVNALYYPLKNSVLHDKNHCPKDQLIALLTSAILEAVQKGFDKTFKFLLLTQTNVLTQEQFMAGKERILANITSLVPEFLSNQFNTYIYLLKQSEINIPSDHVQAILQLAQQAFQTEFNFKQTRSDRIKIKSIFYQLALDVLNELIKNKNFKLHARENLQGKEDALAALKIAKIDYPNLLQSIAHLLVQSPARGYADNMIKKMLENDTCKKEFVRAYMEDLISGQPELTAKAKQAYQAYFIFNNQNIAEEFMEGIESVLPQTINQALQLFNRPVLSAYARFQSHNVYEFYANLRLSNRSQKRQSKNLSASLFKQAVATRGWNLLNTNDNSLDVIETQTITEASLGRKDVIECLGPYDKIFEMLVQIREFFKNEVDDVAIAKWLRNILSGQSPTFSIPLPLIQEKTILQKLHAITYLLFGCEVARNPAMIVINHMILDLVINNSRFTFEELFTGKIDNKPVPTPYLMPMAPEGAVAVARALSTDLRALMPYPYLYRGTESHEAKDGDKFNLMHLVTLEAKVVRAWLIDNTKNYDKVAKADLPQWLLNQIEKQLPIWFNSAGNTDALQMGFRNFKL